MNDKVMKELTEIKDSLCRILEDSFAVDDTVTKEEIRDRVDEYMQTVCPPEVRFDVGTAFESDGSLKVIPKNFASAMFFVGVMITDPSQTVYECDDGKYEWKDGILFFTSKGEIS